MNKDLLVIDIVELLHSKRVLYPIIGLFTLGLISSFLIDEAPDPFRNLFQAIAGSKDSTVVFLYIWFDDIIIKFFLIVVIFFGLSIFSADYDDNLVETYLSKPQSRLEFFLRKTVAAAIVLFVVYLVGNLLALVAAQIIIGDISGFLFLKIQFLIFPLAICVFLMTICISCFTKASTLTIIISLFTSFFLIFTYSYLLLTGEDYWFNNLIPFYHANRIIINYNSASIITESISVIAIFCVVFILIAIIRFRRVSL